MPISLKTLFENTKKSYQLSLLAGVNGIDETVSWVYLSEDIKTTDFIRGNELIITTGLESKSEVWLKTLIDQLIFHNASGLIVNVGKYIKQIPEETISYCNQKGFPLFSMPWEIHLVDIIREFSSLIIEKEKMDWNVSNALEHAIFNPLKTELYESNLLRNGFERNGMYSVAIIHIDIEEGLDRETLLQRFLLFTRTRLSFDCDKYNVFEKNRNIIITFYQKRQEEVKGYLHKLRKEFTKQYSQHPIFIGVGSTVMGVNNLNKSHKRASASLEQAVRKKEEMLCFAELGMHKLLLSVDDQDILYEMQEETLGKIIAYDQEHNTDYQNVLRLYIEYNSNIQAVADALFAHRNTINYRMKKIRELLGTNLETMQERCNYLLSFYVSDILKEKE